MSNTATTTARIRYIKGGEPRRDWLRVERHLKDPEELAAHMYNPQYGWAVDPTTLPPTDEQWRQIGLAMRCGR